jgi:hypothetical protein
MYDGAAYIPDMSSSQGDLERAHHRQRNAEARQRERPPLSPGALRARRSRDLQQAGLTVFHVVGHKRLAAGARSGLSWQRFLQRGIFDDIASARADLRWPQ